MKKTTEDFKDSLLRFASSELTSHASHIIGFAIILFAFLNVVSQYFQPVPLKAPFWFTESTWRYIVVFGILWVVTAIIFFALMRLVFWGKLAHNIIVYEGLANSLEKLYNDTRNKVENDSFFKIPLRWYSRGISATPTGLLVSLVVGFFVSIVLILAFLFY